MHASHKKGVEIKEVDINKVNDELWNVKSQKNDTPTCYIVQKQSASMCTNRKHCLLSCANCNICIHEFSCSCPDYQIKFNLCKHIHAIAYRFFKFVNSSHSEETTEIDSEQLLQCATAHSAQKNLSCHDERLKSKLDVLYGLVSQNISEKASLSIEKLVDNCIELARKDNLTSSSDVKRQPANKNLERQFRFQSTKRKRVDNVNNVLKKPTNQEKELLQEDLKVVKANDHTYCKNTSTVFSM